MCLNVSFLHDTSDSVYLSQAVSFYQSPNYSPWLVSQIDVNKLYFYLKGCLIIAL
jgi:hypothetical protein